jgi:hypothetical protein
MSKSSLNLIYGNNLFIQQVILAVIAINLVTLIHNLARKPTNFAKININFAV